MGAWIETSHLKEHGEAYLSHPYMGAWIETIFTESIYNQITSHPYMGAWIETHVRLPNIMRRSCRTLTWVRGLKHFGDNQVVDDYGRTLTWVRGLKHRIGGAITWAQ